MALEPIKRVASLTELKDNWQGNFNLMPMPERLRWRQELVREMQAGNDSEVVIALLGKLDLFFLASVILRYRQLAPTTHRPLANFLEDPATPRKVLMMPRGWFKTTLGTKGDVIRLCINDPDIRILICNATAENAEAFLSEIEDQFTSNELLRKLYNYCIPRNLRKVRWNSRAMELLHTELHSESTVEAIGVGGTATSRHFNVLKRDDLVEFRQMQSRTEMDSTVEWGRYIVGLFTPNVGERVYRWDHVIGTRWSYYDFISNLLEKHPEYVVHVLEDTDPVTGESTFPEVYPLSVIEQIRRDCESDRVYYCQYKNKPMPDELAKFKEEHIQWVDTLPPDLRVYTFIDPSVGEEESACQQAVVTVGFDVSKHWFVLDCSYGVVPLSAAGGAPSLMNMLFDHYLSWTNGVHTYCGIQIEAFAFQKAIKHLVRLESVQRGVYPLVYELPAATTRSKDARISGLEGPFAHGVVYFYRKGRGLDELKKQLLGYPAYKYRDLVDALAWATHVVRAKAAPGAVTVSPDFFVVDQSQRAVGINLGVAMDSIDKNSRVNGEFSMQAAMDRTIAA